MNLYYKSEDQRIKRDLFEIKFIIGPCSFFRVKGKFFLGLTVTRDFLFSRARASSSIFRAKSISALTFYLMPSFLLRNPTIKLEHILDSEKSLQIKVFNHI